MSYVDGIIIPVPKKKLAAYRAMSKKFGKVCREHGALEYRESVADDVKVGKRTSFPRSVKLKSERDRGVRMGRLQIARRNATAPRPRS